MKQRTIIVFILAFVCCVNTFAQENPKTERVSAQNQSPQGFDNWYFSVLYFNGKSVYNPRNYVISSDGIIDDIKINPSYTSYTTLEHTKKGATYLNIWDINELNQTMSLKTFKKKNVNITSIAYSHDAKQLAISSADKTISICTPIKCELIKSYQSEVEPRQMEYSGNNYFLAVSDGVAVQIWNLERDVIRTTLKPGGSINDFKFNTDDSQLMVLTNDGKLHVYNTKDFTKLSTIEQLDQAIACCPNMDGKYVAVLNTDTRISIINLLDPTERHFIDNANGNISNIRIVYNNVDHKPCLIYNDAKNIIYRVIDSMTPYYNKMMTTELNGKMGEWVKRMPNEPLEMYQARVTESTRAMQVKKFEREFATRMATGMLESAEVSIGNYNMATNSLVLHFSNMSDIFLPVPLAEVSAFTDAKKLQFHDAQYMLTTSDKFDLIYAEVLNTVNGKNYVFDNLNQQPLSYMSTDDNFVPLEVIQKASMEETALMGIKDDILKLAKQEQVVTDKTHIAVKTNAVPAVNADGKHIVNYEVGFTYEVEEEFSARDDFKPGHYHVEESQAVMLMLQIMRKAFESDFKQYMAEGKRVQIQVKGTADASPIVRALAYDGKYGEYEGEPVYKNGELSNITLTKKNGMADNEQLAFARALGVKNYIQKDIAGIDKMNTDFQYHIEVAKEEGSKFRRISVKYTFVDAF